jgi:preprotein translocase subunit SecY
MFLYLPQQINLFVNADENSKYGKFLTVFYGKIWLYGIVFIALIVVFNVFYTFLTYNPTKIANQLRQNNGQILGIRSGKATADYFIRVFKRMLIYGSIFLSIIAIFPVVFQKTSGISLAISGTSILILVNVALELKKNLKSQLIVRNHKGFLNQS